MLLLLLLLKLSSLELSDVVVVAVAVVGVASALEAVFTVFVDDSLFVSSRCFTEDGKVAAIVDLVTGQTQRLHETKKKTYEMFLHIFHNGGP
jgi:hypothetical protein